MLQKGSSYNGEEIIVWDSKEKHVYEKLISVFHRSFQAIFKSALCLPIFKEIQLKLY